MSRIVTLFTENPASVDESFGEHFLFAAKFSMALFAATGAVFVHAPPPFLFEKAVSRIVVKLQDRTHSRGA